MSQYSCRDGTHGCPWMWERKKRELPSSFHVTVWDISYLLYLTF